MIRYLVFLCLFLSTNTSVLKAQNQALYNTNFDEGIVAWKKDRKAKLKVLKENGNDVLKTKRGMARLPLNVSAYAGNDVQVKVKVKSDGVTAKPVSWNGIKIMMHIPRAWEDLYPQAELPITPFDWKEEVLQVYLPDETDTVWLCLGLEGVKGNVMFDDVSVTISEKKQPAVIDRATDKYTGHTEQRLRGMMVQPNAVDSDLRTLAAWGANHVRWQLSWDGFPNSKADHATPLEYKNWLESCLQHVDKMLPVCRELGIKVVIDFHTLPGGRMPGVMTHRIFQSKEWQDMFIELWQRIANRYKDETTIWGYDLANEPMEGTVPEGLMNWPALAAHVGKLIREIDTTHALIVEAAPGGGPDALVAMKPLPLDKVVYSFHMYMPLKFTHQAINDEPATIRYPGLIDGREWNIDVLRKALNTVKKWQEENNVHIYVGEFSAIRWAPGESAYYYLRDCIELFEDYGWDWAYHAFREWQGWSAELDNIRTNEKLPIKPSTRQQLFMQWFSKNNNN